MKIEQKSNLKKNSKVSISWNLPCFFAFLVNSSSNPPHSAIKCRTSPFAQFFLEAFSPSSSSFFILAIVTFLLCCYFFGKGSMPRNFLEIQISFHLWKWMFQPSMTKNFFPHFWNTFILSISKNWKRTPSSNNLVWIYKTNHVNIRCTKKWNGGCVHSTMFSSIHEMFSILAQSQFLKTSGKKTLKNNENNEK